MKEGWTPRAIVEGTSGRKYQVSQYDNTFYGCECQAWLFQKKAPKDRKPCQHILQYCMSQMQQKAQQPKTPPPASITKKEENRDKVNRFISFEDL